MSSIYLFLALLLVDCCIGLESVVISSGDFQNEKEYKSGLGRVWFQQLCEPSPCQNGGTCIVGECVQTGCSLRCECPDGFEGEYCSIPKSRQLNLSSNSSVCSIDKCVGVGCECVESCRHENGYYCLNSMGYIGDDCTVYPPQLDCRENQIVLRIPENFVLQFTHTFEGFTMFIAQSYEDDHDSNLCEAQPDRRDGSYIIIVPLPFSTCGSTTHQGDKIVYSNTLWMDRTVESSLYRFPQPMIDFACSYDMSYIVTTSLLPVFDIPTIINGSIKGEVFIGLCKQSTCNQACPSNMLVQRGAVYTVGQRIHVNVHVNTNHAVFRTEVLEAYLSCSPSETKTGKEITLQQRCEAHSSLQVRLSQRSVGGGACMSFLVPKMTSCQEVYLHFVLRICFPQDYDSAVCGNSSVAQPGSCGRRQKRSAASQPTEMHGGTGPIVVVEGHPGSNEISFKRSDGETSVVVVQKPVPPKTKKPQKKSELDTNELVIGFLAFAGTLMVICVLLLIYSYSRRNRLSGDDSPILS